MDIDEYLDALDELGLEMLLTGGDSDRVFRTMLSVSRQLDIQVFSTEELEALLEDYDTG